MAGSLAKLDHTGISCPSKGGTSHFLRTVGAQFMRAGNKVAVCDPLGYRWPASFVTTDIYRLLAWAKSNRDALLLIDEPGLTPLDKDKDLKWLYTTSRHQGHVCYCAMQDFTQVNKGARKQFTQLYLFRCHPAEAEEWAYQFHADRDFIMRFAPHLPQYAFIRLRSFAPPEGPFQLPA
jgi:hypothetical protein